MKKIAVMIGVMIGSDSDLPQCLPGLEYLEKAEKKGKAKVVNVITNSIHRHPEEVLDNLRRLDCYKIDVLIAGAGMANALTGICDSFLRKIGNKKTVVIGVAFMGKTALHTKVAAESIQYVPGTQVVFDDFVGAAGFTRACRLAVEEKLPKIELKDFKPAQIRMLGKAIAEAKRILNEKEVKKDG